MEGRHIDSSESLRPYVPRLLIEWLREDPTAPFKQVEGTLAFVDISGFTKMCERLARKGKVGAEEVNDVLDASFTELLSIAYDDGGGVVKWGGDAVLLLYTGSRHVERASRAAFRMREKLREIGGRLRTSAGLISLRMSVGIHSGRFQFFLVGGLHRELVITGPSATRTVLAESIATAGDVVLTPEAAALLDERFLGRSKGLGRLLRSAPTGFPHERSRRVENTSDLDLASAIPTHVRDYLLQGGGEAEHRHVAVAFIEFGGTDALLERSGPEALRDALDELMRSVQEACHEHDVSFHETDISTDGGKILLVAGAPKTSGHNEERMLRAVRAIMDRRYALTVRVGINDGYVFAGNFGPPYRRAYSIKGDAVNLAARVMGKAAAGQVLATASVLDRSRTEFEMRALEPFLVKGKKQPVLAYEVGAVKGFKAAGKRLELPFVGRDAELAVLLGGLTAAREGTGRLFDVIGEPGIGKSRLLRELKDRATGFRVLSVACDPYESSNPYHPFRVVLREVVGIPSDVDASSSGRLLEERVRESAPQLLPWLPLLATPLDADVDPTPESDQLEMEFKKARTEEVTGELLTTLLPGPTLVIFEDVHWMDEPSGDLVRVLASSLTAKPWMFCVTRREQPTGFNPAEGLETVSLRPAPLSGGEAAALAKVASDEAPLPPHAVAALAERSGGNPLFLEELIAATQASRSVEALPDSIEALLTAQIDRLPTSDRTLLRFASVLGATFDRYLLDAALATDHPTITPGAWERLTDFLSSDASGLFRFRHALIRDVAYEGLPYRRRREVHGRVAETIERSTGPNAQQHAELLSLHFFQAGRYEKAWSYSTMAGARAQTKFANVEAADFFSRALESARRLGTVSPSELAGVMESLGDVSERAGLYKQAASAYRDARQLVGEVAVARAGLLLKEGLIRERAGRYSDAVAWYRRGLQVLEDTRLDQAALAIRARIRVWYASSRRQQGRFLEALEWCHRAIEDATAAGEREALAHAYRMLDRLYTNLGRPESAQYRDLALPIYQELGNLVGESEVLNELGADAYFEGRWSEALDLYQRSTESRLKTGDEVNAAHGTHNIAEILSDQGHLEEAEGLFREVLRIWRAAGFRLGIGFATSNLGRVAARAGRHQEAARLYEEALSAFRAKQAGWEVLESRARMAENLLLSGQAERALELATQTVDSVEGLGGLPVLRAMLHRLRGYALIDSDLESAGRCFEDSLEWSRSANAPYETALTLLAKARLATTLGDPSAATLEAEAWTTLDGLRVVSVPQPPLASLLKA